MLDALLFRHIIAADFEFEFGGYDGNRPRPVCMVARDLRTNQEWRLWRGEFGSAPPFPIGPDALFIAYYASAELGCFKALGWSMPANIVDLYVEFRNRTNGVRPIAGNGLLGALVHFGLDHINAEEKDEMRNLILHGDPESARPAVLDYCASDIAALERLFPAMLPRLDLDRALIRGRYMKAAALMEWYGVPIDVDTLVLFRDR